MNTEYMYTVVAVMGTLVENGWTAADELSVKCGFLATKDYETAVGIKTASIRAAPIGENDAFVSAEYQSEGRNILSAEVVRIAGGTDTLLACQVVAGFIKRIESIINESYAARLK